MSNEKKSSNPVDFSKGSFLWCIWEVLKFALVLTGGILLICYSGHPDAQGTILAVVGWYLIVIGSIDILANFLPVLTIREKVTMTNDLIVGGGISLALGITFVIAHDNVAIVDAVFSFAELALSIIMIVAGALIFFYGLAALFNKYIATTGASIFAIVLGAGIVVLGSFCVYWIYNFADFTKAILIIAGIVLILFSLGILVNVVDTMKLHRLKRDFSNTVKATYTEHHDESK